MKTSLGRCSIRRVSPPRHVLVCGAGVVGASVAYCLARRGIAVTVVERSGVACAASGKSGGFLALDWCDASPLGPLARASFALHAELAKELGTDYGYRRMDTFMLAARERGALTGGHRVAAPPWLDGSGVVTATLGSTETTAQVTPARFTGALLDAAPARGAKLHLGVVDDVARRDGPAAGGRSCVDRARAGAHRAPPGLLSPGHRRRPAADRSRSRRARRVRRDRSRPVGNTQRAGHRARAGGARRRGRGLVGRSAGVRSRASARPRGISNWSIIGSALR